MVTTPGRLPVKAAPMSLTPAARGLLLLAVAHDNGLLKGVIVVFQDDFCRMSLDNDNLLGDHSHVRNNECDLFSRRLQFEITVKIGDSGNRRLSFHDDSGPDQRLTSGV